MNTATIKKIKSRILLFAIIIIIVVTKEYFYPTQTLERSGKKISGLITGVDRGKGGFVISVRYEINEKTYENTTHNFSDFDLDLFRNCSQDNTCEGKKCYITYLPNQPNGEIIVSFNLNVSDSLK